jgi:parallel beta-helix repeat protein
LTATYGQDILIDNNQFIGGRAVGISIISSHNVTLTNSMIADIRRREEMVM